MSTLDVFIPHREVVKLLDAAVKEFSFGYAVQRTESRSAAVKTGNSLRGVLKKSGSVTVLLYPLADTALEKKIKKGTAPKNLPVMELHLRGNVLRKVLTSSQLHFDSTNPLFRRFHRWLMAQKVVPLRQGVRGMNMKAPRKTAVYKNVWYSLSAVELLDKGILWKQSPEYNVYFKPLKGAKIS